MATTVETDATTTTLKNNGNSYITVDTNDKVTIPNDLAVTGATTLATPLPIASGGTGAAVAAANTPDVDASVASNALTCSINPCTLAFRSTTLTDGTPSLVDIGSTISVVVPSGATLGTIANWESRVVILAINNAGTIEAAVINLDGGTVLNEAGVITTTAIGTGSDTKGVAYSTTARTGVSYRVVGVVESVQVTPGTWAAAPDLVQPSFGNALTSLDSIGYGQTWTSPSRSAATDYYNNTGRPIQVTAYSSFTASASIAMLIDGVTMSYQQTDSANNNALSVSGIVPPGSKYRINVTGFSIADWLELR
jgi:hypothetical protein